MASRGQSLTLTYTAWDTGNNVGKTGDVANHTLRWIADGTSAAPGNSPAEVDATNAPGVYKVVLTAAECTCWLGTLCGKSSTADVSIMPLTVTFEAVLAGTGARTVTVTVDDGSDPLENAIVRFTEGGNTYVGSTDASGEVVFSLDDATYAVTIAKAGYSFTPTTLVVDGTETQTYSMSALTITAPPNASTITGVMTVYDEEGVVEESVEVSVQITEGPGTDGLGYDTTAWTETSNASGIVQFAGLIKGAQYKIWRGTSTVNAQKFTAPTSGDSFDLAEVIGRG